MTQEIYSYLPSGFRTSVDALEVVMGIPASVIKNELQKNNYTITDCSSNCIDVKMLERFELLYRKKLKRYFLASVKNFDNLTREERTVFIEFSNRFSKNQELTLSWRKIDKDAIREHFFSLVKEETKTSMHFAIEVLLKICPSKSLESVISRGLSFLRVSDATTHTRRHSTYLKLRTEPYVNQYPFNPQESQRTQILRKVVRCRLYRLRNHVSKQKTRKPSAPILRLYSCLRLHIVSDDGTSDGNERVPSA
jgi:hypothetical protein